MAGSPEAGLVTVVLVRSDGPDELRLAPVHGREKRGEHRHVVVLDGFVDAAQRRWRSGGRSESKKMQAKK